MSLELLRSLGHVDSMSIRDPLDSLTQTDSL